LRDLDIRTALHRDLRLEHQNDEDTLILDELGLCQGSSRVDVAVVNGAITGYEIKSPKDTLERLPQQQEIYSRTLDRVIIIAGESHLKHVFNIVPEWWGISVPYLEGDTVSFHMEREAQNNPKVDPYALVQLLWREEALEELRILGMERGVASKPRAYIWERLANAVDIDELANIVRRRLKSRSNWRSGN
jgi:hypothetical protein